MGNSLAQICNSTVHLFIVLLGQWGLPVVLNLLELMQMLLHRNDLSGFFLRFLALNIRKLYWRRLFDLIVHRIVGDTCKLRVVFLDDATPRVVKLAYVPCLLVVSRFSR